MTRNDALLATGYRYFLMVADTGSLRGAARQFNIAPSAISRQIARLEDEMGLPLFERSGKALRLTVAGEVLHRGLSGVAQGHQQTLDAVSGLRGLSRGHIHVATVESLSVAVVPEMLAAFGAKFPGIDVAVTVAGSDAVAELVRSHKADVGFTFNPTALKDLEVVQTIDMQLGAVVAPGHALAKLSATTLRECLEHAVAWPSQGLSLRTILDSVALRLVPHFRPAFECNSLRLMASLARAGRCISFQTRIGIEAELKQRQLVFIPLTDKKLPRDRLMVVMRSSSAANPAAKPLLALAGQLLKQAATVAQK